MIFELIAIIAPVFACAAIGFVWGRSAKPYDTEMVTNLVTLIGAPCLIFTALVSVKLDLAAMQEMALVSTIAIFSFAGIGFVILKASGQSIRSFLPSLTFTNCGNVGLPLSFLAFGDPGIAFAAVYFAISTIIQFTLGIGLISGSASLGRFLRMPLIYAIALAVVVMTTSVVLPKWILNTLDILSGMTIPLMLITLGVSLARLQVKSLPRSTALSVLRLVMGFGVGVFLAWVFNLEGAARGVLILQSAMPVAVFNYLFSQRYNTNPTEVAGMVVISTILSFATLMPLLWFVL